MSSTASPPIPKPKARGRKPKAESPRPKAQTGPRPFLKWAGGKRQVLPHLRQHVPSSYGTYHEPFVGGGALFFDLQPARAWLSDINERLVRAYRGVRDDPEKLIRRLRKYPHEKEFFLRFRKRPIDKESDVNVAAWLIYLNKTAFNGLYRVNRRNEFNVPFGDYVRPNTCDAVNLRACSAALAGAKVEHEDFAAVLERAQPKDFVYFDPPYVPLSATSSFTSYTSSGFAADDQRRLRDVALELKRRGVHVLLSNSSAPFVRDLYSHAFRIEEISARRQINSKVERRGALAELVIS